MAADDHLSGQQFSAYRGLHLGHTDLHGASDEEIMGRLQPAYPAHLDPQYRDRAQPFGQHWTPMESTARKFALSRNFGHRFDMANPGSGVVLQAHTSSEPEVIPYMAHESHVRVPGASLERVTLHVHQFDPTNPKKSRQDTRIRSFDLPEHLWRA